MNTHADKTQENKSQLAANFVSPKKSGSESAFQFKDNRPEAVVQRKLHVMASNSPHLKQLMAFQEVSNNSERSRQFYASQRKEEMSCNKMEATERSKQPIQRKIVDKADLNTPYEFGESKAGNFGGAQASLFYTAKGYPHIHATETLSMKSGKGKKKKDVVLIEEIHHSDGNSTFWWKDGGNGNFVPKTNSETPSDAQEKLATEFVNGWGNIS